MYMYYTHTGDILDLFLGAPSPALLLSVCRHVHFIIKPPYYNMQLIEQSTTVYIHIYGTVRSAWAAKEWGGGDHITIISVIGCCVLR